MNKKFKITLVVPTNLQNDLRERIIKDGYGLRGKSKWVSEAIDRLLNCENFPELVRINDEMHGFEKAETIVIEYPLKVRLDNAIITIRQEFLTLEGIKSRIVRTAILQRLLRNMDF